MEHFSFDPKKNKSGKDILPLKPVINNENINPQEGKSINAKKDELTDIIKVNKKESGKRKDQKISIKNQTILRFFGKNLLNSANEAVSPHFSSLYQKYKNLDEVEKAQLRNPQYVVEYSSEIMSFLKSTEKINLPDYSSDFIKRSNISEKARRILIDWLISVHFKFELLPETLYLTINLIDRVISLNKVSLHEFQLLGVAAMLIASKYEEIYAPEIRDFIYITGRTITKKQILDMESTILNLLNFDILIVSPYLFLNRYHFITKCDLQTYHLATMLLEISFLDINFMKHPSSLISATVLYLARKLLKRSESPSGWNSRMKMHCGYSENELKVCVREFASFYKTVFKNCKLDAIITKFSYEKYMRVGKLFFNSNK